MAVQVSTIPSLHYSDLPLSFIVPRIFIVVTIIPICDFPAGSFPNSLMRANVIESFVEILDAERQTDDERMKGQCHYLPASFAFLVERVELVADHPVILLRRKVRAHEHPHVVDALFIRNHDHSARLDSHRRRLIVAGPVADILKALGSEVIRRIERLDQSWAEPALGRLSGRFGDRFLDFANDLTFFVLRVTAHVPAIGLTVPQPLPFALVALLA